ncbi:MAG: hypothetical protein QW358_00385 [Candidatus Hadarchaeum sp.]
MNLKTVRTFLLRQRVLILGVLTFILSGILAGIIINLLSAWLEQVFGQTTEGLLRMLLIGILVALLLAGVVWLLSRETHRWLPLPREMHARPHAGLIALVGPGPKKIFLTKPEDSPASAAIRYHSEQGKLKQVWLITSEEGAPVAEELRQLYENRAVIHIVLPLIRDILDINDTFECANHLAAELKAKGWKEEDVIADYTAGTSSMSVGLALAALLNGFSMEFMSQVAGSASVPLQTGLQGSWVLTKGKVP